MGLQLDPGIRGRKGLAMWALCWLVGSGMGVALLLRGAAWLAERGLPPEPRGHRVVEYDPETGTFRTLTTRATR
ncbi:hypothetical protein [Actinoalloteichus caeruleus]|uniref:hypothetical protein n=1 Tax=Actinoalloteichus cyanogriseus TaxID=2893586 RepID=UPI00138DDBD2|nr:hypothetical protein [Actinoalloteichus caeruleus]